MSLPHRPNPVGTNGLTVGCSKIKGVGRRYSNLVCKKADVDLNKRAGELTSEELERLVTIIQNPTAYKIPGVRFPTHSRMLGIDGC